MLHISKFSGDKSLTWEQVSHVKSVAFYRHDVVISYQMKNEAGATRRGEKRDITTFSRKSRMTLAFIANNSPVEFTHMITLTYPAEYETDGRVVKKHLNRFLSWCRSQASPFSYLWFLEWQKRGAPHFHILTTQDFSKVLISQRWYEAVSSGDEKHLGAGTRVERIRKKEGARRYAVKYASKTRQKNVPKNYRNVGRFFGYSRDVKPKPNAVANDVRMSLYELLYWLDDWPGISSLQENPMSTLYNASYLADDLRAFLEMRQDALIGTY